MNTFFYTSGIKATITNKSWDLGMKLVANLIQLTKLAAFIMYAALTFKF